ncbi:MAG TPA: hypothetical protein PKO27_17770 [Deltaproteobacteria bacterium]|jgi:hypothetical protein|nr:hypothetical protein [Deltaproteobacteria bacterium]
MMKEVRDCIRDARAILDSISAGNYRSVMSGGPLEESAAYMVGRAIGELDYAIIIMDAHDEVYGKEQS